MPENRQRGDPARRERDRRTNASTVKVIQQALQECGLPAAAVQAIDSPDRALVGEMLKMDKYIDMLIPRGGAGLHKLCRERQRSR